MLVHLGLAGPAHGTLILDPDGNRVRCDQASFLWHERDAQGTIIALNEEVEYELGTYAPYVGAVPDPDHPGLLKPVWGKGEFLGLTLSVVDTNGVMTEVATSYGVHAEPDKPDHFASGTELMGGVDPVFEFWSDAFSPYDGPFYGSNVYYLLDRYNNLTFGYTDTTPPPPSPAVGVSVTFRDQTGGGSMAYFGGVDYAAYELGLQWPRVPDGTPPPPEGSMATTVAVTYPSDPEWPGGTVAKAVQLQFDRGTFHSLMGRLDNYDGSWMDSGGAVDDTDFPITVSPGATGDALPKVATVRYPAYSEYLGQGVRTAFVILTNSTGPIWWGWGPDPTAQAFDSWDELSDSPAFRVSLIDAKGNVATDAAFRVHLCPRFDHFGPERLGSCTQTPVESAAGVVQSVRLNPASPTS